VLRHHRRRLSPGGHRPISLRTGYQCSRYIRAGRLEEVGKWTSFCRRRGWFATGEGLAAASLELDLAGEVVEVRLIGALVVFAVEGASTVGAVQEQRVLAHLDMPVWSMTIISPLSDN
jgi:hypothetical protein